MADEAEKVAGVTYYVEYTHNLRLRTCRLCELEKEQDHQISTVARLEIAH